MKKLIGDMLEMENRQLHPFQVGFFTSKTSCPVIFIFIFAACIVWVTDRAVLLLKKGKGRMKYLKDILALIASATWIVATNLIGGNGKMTDKEALKTCYCPMCFKDHVAMVMIDTEDRLTAGLVLDKPRVPCSECLGVVVEGGRC